MSPRSETGRGLWGGGGIKDSVDIWVPTRRRRSLKMALEGETGGLKRGWCCLAGSIDRFGVLVTST